MSITEQKGDYMATQQISNRAKAWNVKPLQLEGIWFDTNEAGQIVLNSIVNNAKVQAVLTGVQALALKTLLNIELTKGGLK